MAEATVQEIWSKTCAHLSEVMHPDVYSRWIAVIEPFSMENNTFTLAVDNDFYQTWLEENYLSMINSAISTVSGTEVKIVFRVKPQAAAVEQPVENMDEIEAAEQAKKPTIRERTARKKIEPALNPKFNFESFIVGSSNSFAHAASMAVSQAPARAYNPLFIYGGTGLGKTHLMQAIGHHVLSTSRATVCYISSETMMNEYIDALQARTLVQFRKKYRSTDLLLIDDIHFLAGKERLQEEFFHTFNALFDMRKQIVLTSDRPASEISGLEQRLVSRFEWGLVTELESPDLETRIAILREKQAHLNVKLSDELIQFIATNIKSNVRRLEGALIRSISYASLTNRELTLESLQYLLRDTLEQEKQPDLSFDSIQRAVAEFYDVRIADMTSKRRPRNVSGPRQVAMYLCRKFTNSSLPDIANAFGKTHATILHAYRAIGSRMDVDQRLRQDVVQLAQKIGKSI